MWHVRYLIVCSYSPSFSMLKRPYIFLTVLLSNIPSIFVSSMVIVQVSDTQGTIGHIRVLCSFNLVFQDRSLDLKHLMCTRHAQFAVMILEWRSVHSLFSLFTADPRYVMLSTYSSLKLSVVKFWKYLLACVDDIFMYCIYSNAR